MLANLDRDQFLTLLKQLGEEEDEAVLAAARDLHAQITVAGLDWDDLLVPEAVDEPEEYDDDDLEDDEGEDETAAYDDDADDDLEDDDLDEDDDDAGEDDDDDRDEDEDERALTDEEKAEATSLIEKLLEKGVSASTKEELEEYKIDLADGDFVAMDLRYLRALHQRLTK